MTYQDEVIYTQKQKDLIDRMSKEIVEAKEYIEKNKDMWGERPTFYSELHPFVDLAEDVIVAENYSIAQRIFNFIEEFLEDADEELQEHIAYFFFEDLTNWLGHEDSKYMKKFVEMLGPNCKECCRIVDRFWGTKTPGL